MSQEHSTLKCYGRYVAANIIKSYSLFLISSVRYVYDVVMKTIECWWAIIEGVSHSLLIFRGTIQITIGMFILGISFSNYYIVLLVLLLTN